MLLMVNVVWLATCMKPCVLLDMWQLLKTALAVRTLVRLLPRVNPVHKKGIKKRKTFKVLCIFFNDWQQLTWCAGQVGGCWRTTWGTADTDAASPAGQFSMKHIFQSFLAVQNSSIGDLVTHWVNQSLSEWPFDFNIQGGFLTGPPLKS